MQLKDGLATMHGPGRGSAWRWFPWVLAACMGVVIVANVTMVCVALGTFPGEAGSDGFDLSNHYNRVLNAVQRQAALGWSLRLLPGDAGRPVLLLTDRTGAPLHGARIEATAERPLGPPQTTHLRFRDAGNGRYVADAMLTAEGQWELQVFAAVDGHTLATTQRLVVGATPHPAAMERSARSDL